MARTPSIKTTIERALGISISSSLSTKDKAAMMEHLLTLPTGELKRISECDKAPSFVSLCANMLRRDELLEYMQILSILHK